MTQPTRFVLWPLFPALLTPSLSNGYARYALSSVYVKQGLLNQAIAEREKTVRLHPEIGAFHTGLADAYVQARHTHLAIPEYRKALEVQPADTRARQQLDTLLKGRP
jgi:Tfp pilus assembly protein PilF